MSANEPQLKQLAMAHLPSGAELVVINKPAEHAAVYAADLTEDGVPEVTAVYRLNGELSLLVLQYLDGIWEVSANVKGWVNRYSPTRYELQLYSSDGYAEPCGERWNSGNRAMDSRYGGCLSG
ncbi:hypothetical protein [Paenibacillus sp. N3/727]|uniref:hypothetical protein n=1 Tax=Paenibacillus sp. N3/727 TaxID=2925845 RepID=UPI00321FB380